LVYNFGHMLQPRQGEKPPSDVRIIKPYSEVSALAVSGETSLRGLPFRDREKIQQKSETERMAEIVKIVAVYKEAFSKTERSKAWIEGLARGNDNLLRLFLKQHFQGSQNKIDRFFVQFGEAVAKAGIKIGESFKVYGIRQSVEQVAGRIEQISQMEIENGKEPRTIFATSVNFDANLAVDLLELTPHWVPGKNPALELDINCLQAKGVTPLEEEEVEVLEDKAKRVREMGVDQAWFEKLAEERRLITSRVISEDRLLDMVIAGTYQGALEETMGEKIDGLSKEFEPIFIFYNKLKLVRSVNAILRELEFEEAALPIINLRKIDFRCLIRVPGAGDVEMEMEDAKVYWEKMRLKK